MADLGTKTAMQRHIMSSYRRTGALISLQGSFLLRISALYRRSSRIRSSTDPNVRPPGSNDPRPFFNGPELAPATWYATWDRPGASPLDLIFFARSAPILAVFGGPPARGLRRDLAVIALFKPPW